MLRATLPLCLAFALLPSLASAAPSGDAPALNAEREAENKALRRRFKKLKRAEKVELREFFEAELRVTDTFQLQLLRYVLGTQEVDRGAWPDAEPAQAFDAETHAPGAARRKPLKSKSAKVKRARERFLRKVPERGLTPAWSYDYATRGLVRLADPRDPELVFENALAGFAPDHDLAEALVERMLDDGSQAATLGAFAHAYTDRNGGVYEGLTLYDGWASGTLLEMPDVDCLGVIHTVLDDWKTWSAPVKAKEQDPLYERIGELFNDAYLHRSLRHALARTFLGGSVVLRDGYTMQINRLHTLWEENASTPKELVQMLPDAESYGDFLDEWGRLTDKHPEKLAAGKRRRGTLDQGHATIRATLVRVLEELEAQLEEADEQGG
jgi:hypothetical protein